MELQIYVVKVKSQAGNMKLYEFCRKIQQRASGPGENIAGVTFMSMRMHPKSCHNFT